MREIFLSASVPIPERGRYHKTADPFLIQIAVRELIAAVIRDYLIVWGGHPAITPMVWSICQDLDVNYANSVILYQSEFFEDRYPEENRNFRNTIYVAEVPGDREASLARMREEMLARGSLIAAVFVGGMEGVQEEFNLFTRLHPEGKVLALGAPGGAARELAQAQKMPQPGLTTVDFARLFREQFPTASSA